MTSWKTFPVLHGDQDFHFKQSQTPDFKVETETVMCTAMCPTTPTDTVGVCSVTISRDTVMCSSSPSSMPASQRTPSLHSSIIGSVSSMSKCRGETLNKTHGKWFWSCVWKWKFQWKKIQKMKFHQLDSWSNNLLMDLQWRARLWSVNTAIECETTENDLMLNLLVDLWMVSH